MNAVEQPLTDWIDVLEALLSGQSLNAATTAWVMAEMLTGAAPPANTAAFLVALRAKGETAAEVSGLVVGHAERRRAPADRGSGRGHLRDRR